MKFWKIKTFRISIIFISIIILSFLIFGLPRIANYFEEVVPEYIHMKLPLLLGIYSTGIPFFIAVFNLFKLLKLVSKDVVFTMESINYLNIISKCCISEMILYCSGILYLYFGKAMNPGVILLSLLIILVAFIIYIFIEILKELLLKAVELKNENELTI